MMNDEQFEAVLDFIRRNWNSGGNPVAELRARDTDQREAIDAWKAAHAREATALAQAWEQRDTAQAQLREVDAYLSGHGDNAICNGSRLHRDIKDLLAGQLAIAGTTSDQYRADMYDEVWQKARDMGYANVTDALVALERMKVALPEPVAIANRGKGAFWVRWTDAAEGLYGPGIKLYAAPPAAAHGDEYEIWSAAQLAPGEGIEDGAERIRVLIGNGAHGDEAVLLLRKLDEQWNAHDGEKQFGKLMLSVESFLAMRAQAGEGGEA